jgi:beta-mannosidase
LLTAGPWRPISLDIYASRLEDLYFTTEVADTLESAELVAKADCEGRCTSVAFELSLGGVTIQSSVVDVISQHAETVFEMVSPELWYPATYGKQPMYRLKATLLLNNRELDSMTKRLGIRKAVVVQRELKDAPGSTFFFEINNIPIFCGGSNWIPADSFIPRIPKGKYRSWLRLIRRGNQVMVRCV